jgi:nucleoside-diphosphate-sugar epimerase
VSRVLLTGASGFIGRHAIAPLVAAGHEVHAVSRRPVPDVTWHEADLLADPTSVVREVQPEVLVHLAWYAEHGRFWSAPENVRWVEASLALLRAFGGRRAVIAGTCAEYDWSAEREALAEDAPTRPATLYGAAKHGLHTVAAAYADQAGFELAWGRVFFLYGPGEAPGRLVPAVARALLAGEPARTTDGTQVRDFMHVDDVARGFAALAGADGVTGPVNVASGEDRMLRDVIEEIAAAAGRPDLLELGAVAQRPGEPQRLVADVTRLREEVGFTPAVTLQEGIRAVVQELR